MSCNCCINGCAIGWVSFSTPNITLAFLGAVPAISTLNSGAAVLARVMKSGLSRLAIRTTIASVGLACEAKMIPLFRSPPVGAWSALPSIPRAPAMMVSPLSVMVLTW